MRVSTSTQVKWLNAILFLFKQIRSGCGHWVDLWCFQMFRVKWHCYMSQHSELKFLSLSLSLCKGRTLYSVVRDAKVVLDVNKTRQIAQEMVKVKQLNTDSPEHFCSAHHITEESHLFLFVLRGWATFTQRGSYTKTWSPRTCFMTTAKSSSPTLDFSPYLGYCRLAGNCVKYTSEARETVCAYGSLS